MGSNHFEDLQRIKQKKRSLDHILQQEFSEEFVRTMKNRMLVGYFRYGPVADDDSNYVVRALKRVREYLRTGNQEMLVDAANFLMMEFMHPQHPDAHFNPVNRKGGEHDGTDR